MAITKPNLTVGKTKASNIQMEAALERGSYSNLILINHTNEEFILDFLLTLPTKTQLVSRIILSPSHAERLSKILSEHIAKRKKDLRNTKLLKFKMPKRPTQNVLRG